MSSSGYQHFCVLRIHANLLKVFSTFIFAMLAIGMESKSKIFTSIQSGKVIFLLWCKIEHASLDRVFPKHSEFMLAMPRYEGLKLFSL